MKNLNNDLFIPTTIVGYLLPDVSGNGTVVLTPDWRIDKVQEEYNKGITNKETKKCLAEAPKVFNNYNFPIKVDKVSKQVYVKLDPTMDWVKCIFDKSDDSVASCFNEKLLDLVLNTEPIPGDEVVYKDEFSFAFSPNYPGVPFPVSQRSVNYGDYVRKGSKQMMFTTASLYGTKKTKNWKVGHKYVDNLGNSYSIVGEFEMDCVVKDLLIKCLESEKATKKYQSNERDFITTVVEILNGSSVAPITATSSSRVFLYVKDIEMDFSTINERGVDVYDTMEGPTIQILQVEKIGTAYDLGEVFSDEVRAKTPIDIRKIAENTRKCFKFGEFSDPESFPVIPLMSGSYNSIVENLIYVSALIDPVLGTEIPETKDMLKEVLEERLRECLLLNVDDIDPRVSFTSSISTMDMMKKASIFISRILKYSGFFEDAMKYISSFLSFKDLFEKVKNEIKIPQDYIFGSWENYSRYVNYSTLPYLFFDAMQVRVEVDDKIIHKQFELPEKDKVKLGIGLSNVIEGIVSRALIFNGVGVQTYSVQYHYNGKDKIEDRISMVITFNDIKKYCGEDGIEDAVKCDILSNKFYKLSLNILVCEKKEEV
jgi:hypothetical protein